MKNERDELNWSQLADGELSGDEVAEVLLGALDDAARREELKRVLRLRLAMSAWRSQRPERPVMVVSAPHGGHGRGFGRRLIGYAAAACLGGLLVLAGSWAAGAGRPGQAGPVAAAPVSAERMREVARVFALHESVAGPLAWYAADDQNVRLGASEGVEAGQRPVAVLLTLQPAVSGEETAPRTYVIVCRERQSVAIDLPDDLPGAAGMRVYLAPKAVNGRIDMQYAIAVTGSGGETSAATLSGRRSVGLTETPLGQLALGDRLLNVEAAAWSLKESAN